MFLQSNSIEAYLGGFSAAHFREVSKNDVKEETTFDNLNDLRKFPNDLRLFGEVLKTLLENCSKGFQLTEVRKAGK